MRANEFGTNPKRPTRPGSRPARGHEAQPRYKEQGVSEIAGAFPSPSTREKWAKDAAASNAAEAKRLAAKQAIADAERLKVNNAIVDKEQRINYHPIPDNEVPVKELALQMEEIGVWLAERGKASRALCLSSKPDDELGNSNLSSCKSQGLRARDGEKSHLIGHGGSKVRIKVGGKKIKGQKYGGPLPDYGTRKGQR